jgi:glutathione S-transferase
VLSQSGAILEYLEETRPERALLPKDPFVRAQVRSICLLIGADTQPVQNLAVLNKVYATNSRLGIFYDVWPRRFAQLNIWCWRAEPFSWIQANHVVPP